MHTMIMKDLANDMCDVHVLPVTRYQDMDGSDDFILRELPNVQFVDRTNAVNLLNVLTDVFKRYC